MSEFTVPEVNCKACENEVGHYDEPDVDSSALPVFSLHPPVYQGREYFGILSVSQENERMQILLLITRMY